jgi:predicted enzyme related to lactoylglutathione lyase
MKDKGRFVWVDLMTSDVDAAIAFYTETVGWKATPWEGESPYTMFAAGEQSIGGVMAINDEMKAMNVPPHWIGSTRVEDVDASAAKVEELGGKVIKAAWDIPEVGRLAVVADPQGAVFSMFKPKGEMPMPEDGEAEGLVSWHELNTTDYEAAWKFYSALLGWKATEDMDMGPEHGHYFMFQREGAEGSMGGMCNMAKQMGFPSHWLHYTNVDGCEAAIKRITDKGGKVLNGPMEVPGGSYVAQCQDPQGAAFAIHSKTK